MAVVPAATSAPPAPVKAYPPPPFGLLHSHVLVDELGAPFPVPGPWSVTINAPVKSFKDDSYATLSAFLRGGSVRTWLKYSCASFPVKGMSFGLEAAQEAGKLRVSPSVYYKFYKEGENTVSFAPFTGRLTHSWSHNQGTFASDINANVYDYLSLDGCVNSRLGQGLLGGLEFVYDPTRSGLKHYRIGLKYLATHSFSYDGTGALAFSTIRSIIPGRLQAATHLKSTRTGYEATVSVAAFSPCGARLTSKLQAHDGAVAAAVSRIIGGAYRISVAVHGNIYKRTYNGVGVSFSYDQ